MSCTILLGFFAFVVVYFYIANNRVNLGTYCYSFYFSEKNALWIPKKEFENKILDQYIGVIGDFLYN